MESDKQTLRAKQTLYVALGDDLNAYMKDGESL